MAVSLSIIIPTIGRPTLADSLNSISGLSDGDEVLVVGHGRRPLAQTLFEMSGLPGEYREVPFAVCDYGAAGRNEALRYACGDYLLYMDDDDWYTPGAIPTIRKAISRYSGRCLMFRMERPSVPDVLWKEKEVRRGNVGTTMFVHPRLANPILWGPKYEQDYYYARDVLDRMGQEPIWREEITAVIRAVGKDHP